MDIMQDYMQHRGYRFRPNSNTSIIAVVENEHRGYFYVPDSNVALMAGGTGRPITQSSQMAVVEPGQSFYLTSEDDCRTWVATLDENYQLTAKLFADRGGNAVATDADGNVYIADGHVSVYDKSGKQVGTLETPERASGLAFGGADKRTLFIGAVVAVCNSHAGGREMTRLNRLWNARIRIAGNGWHDSPRRLRDRAQRDVNRGTDCREMLVNRDYS